MKESRYFGDRAFYSKVLFVAIPIMIQNGITNFVNMLDNIMVGRLGTDELSGVAIVNQLMFIFFLCIFGAMSGIGIFIAQFYGKGDEEGVRYGFRLEVITAVILILTGVAVFILFGDNLIMQFLHSDNGIGNIDNTFHQAKIYLEMLVFEMLPFAATQVYAGTLRNTGETVVPMKAGLIAVAVNLIGNYILIYGKFGAPMLGVVGAAMATVISRVVEFSYVAIWTHRNIEKNHYIVGAFAHLFDIPGDLVKRMWMKAAPLLLNEGMWSGGQAMLTQCYSVRGLSAVAALNISKTISDVFNIAFIAMGSAIAILIGQTLGAGEIEKARKDAARMTVFSVLLCVVMGFLLFLISGLFPMIYNTTDDIKKLASGFIRIAAICMPVYAFENSAYFTIRSGGKTLITFLFDSCFMWVASIPLAFILSRYTGMPILVMYATVQTVDLIKCAIGYFMMRSGKWAVNLTT
ncbi:MAG: MATE family efflux transporter [Lachnospiraceae bacterium]|nr:MATE family efflux transporter [Lachnospiraceae bacterium]